MSSSSPSRIAVGWVGEGAGGGDGEIGVWLCCCVVGGVGGCSAGGLTDGASAAGLGGEGGGGDGASEAVGCGVGEASVLLLSATLLPLDGAVSRLLRTVRRLSILLSLTLAISSGNILLSAS